MFPLSITSRWLIPVLSSVLIMGEMATDIFLPALPIITEEFSAPITKTQLTLATYILGFALMQLFYGPISDKFGRKLPLLVGSIIFLFSSLLASQVTSIESLIIIRFFQSLGGAAGITVCLAVVRDISDNQSSTKMLARIGTIIAIAPAIAPILGGFLVEWFNWRWTFYALSIWAVVTIFFIYFLIPETLDRSEKNEFNLRVIFNNFFILLSNKLYVGYMLTLMFVFSTFFSFIFGAPFVFINIFGLSESTFPILISIQVGGFILGTSSVNYLCRKFNKSIIFLSGIYIALFSAIFVAAFPIIGIESIVTIIAPMTFYAFSIGFIFPLGVSGALAPFPKIAGTASALLGFSQSLCGVCFGILVGFFFNESVTSMTSLMGIATILGSISYFIFLKKINIS